MTPTELPTDEEVRRSREALEFICTCVQPVPEILDLWQAHQCRICGRKWVP